MKCERKRRIRSKTFVARQLDFFFGIFFFFKNWLPDFAFKLGAIHDLTGEIASEREEGQTRVENELKCLVSEFDKGWLGSKIVAVIMNQSGSAPIGFTHFRID